MYFNTTGPAGTAGSSSGCDDRGAVQLESRRAADSGMTSLAVRRRAGDLEEASSI